MRCRRSAESIFDVGLWPAKTEATTGQSTHAGGGVVMAEGAAMGDGGCAYGTKWVSNTEKAHLRPQHHHPCPASPPECVEGGEGACG